MYCPSHSFTNELSVFSYHLRRLAVTPSKPAPCSFSSAASVPYSNIFLAQSSIDRNGLFGDTPKSALKGASKQMEESMTEKQLEEFAHTKRKGKPEHVRH